MKKDFGTDTYMDFSSQEVLTGTLASSAQEASTDGICSAKFYIEGMSCAACSASIERALSRKDFIKSAQINLITKSAIVKYDSTKASLDDIFVLISKLGFSPFVADSAPKQKLDFTKPSATILGTNPTTIHAQTAAKTPNQILKKLRFFITFFNSLDKRLLPPKLRILCSVLATLLVLYLSMFPMFSSIVLIAPFDDFGINIATQIICTLIVAHMGRDFYFKGFATLFARTPTMDSLIAISTTSAFAYSLWLLMFHTHGGEIPHLYFESICVIITFVLCGKSLESSAKSQANEVINALLSRNVKNAIKLDSLTHKVESNIPIDSIKEGDLLKVLPYSFVPVDGVVASGDCAIDESMLSGEVLPVPKSIDSPLFAGSLNTTQAFIMRATSSAKNSSLSAMIALIEEAITSKPHISRIADKVASVFVPAVIIVALIAGGAWSVAKDFSFGFEIFISTLVISCPCALGLATPLAVMIGNALANKNGVFFKNAQSFETASKVSDVVFDKTGTLTDSALEVREVLSFGELSKDEILAMSASIERGSEHIIAKALIKAAAQSVANKSYNFSDFVAYAGLGIKATMKEASDKKGQVFALGSEKFFKKLDSSISLKSLEKDAICVYLGVQNQDNTHKILGVIYLQDSIKSEAFLLIESLKKHNITPHILSGDIASNVSRVAQELQIDDFIAQASPKDKLEFIQNLSQKSTKKSTQKYTQKFAQKDSKNPQNLVMMIGDGVNDVGALQASDISVSFKEASEVSEKSADIIIYSHDLGKIYYAISLSKAVLANIKQNLFWAFCYNALCIPLACGALYGFGVLLNPMIAAFAMSASSLSVVLNAQRLWRFR